MANFVKEHQWLETMTSFLSNLFSSSLFAPSICIPWQSPHLIFDIISPSSPWSSLLLSCHQWASNNISGFMCQQSCRIPHALLIWFFCVLLKNPQKNFTSMAFCSNHAVFIAFHCTSNLHNNLQKMCTTMLLSNLISSTGKSSQPVALPYADF